MSAFVMRLILGAGLAPLIAAPAVAQMPAHTPAAACTTPAELPEGMTSWRKPIAFKAAGDAKGLATTALTSGQAVNLALLQTPKVAYPLRPEKPGGSVSFGGLARFTVDQPGTWRVALGSAAWIDVVKDGKAAVSTAHGHGPDCTGIRKMVDYSLTPGDYTLQLSANGADSLTVLVTRLP